MDPMQCHHEAEPGGTGGLPVGLLEGPLELGTPRTYDSRGFNFQRVGHDGLHFNETHTGSGFEGGWGVPGDSLKSWLNPNELKGFYPRGAERGVPGSNDRGALKCLWNPGTPMPTGLCASTPFPYPSHADGYTPNNQEADL
jgi:hypothetical protein